MNTSFNATCIGEEGNDVFLQTSNATLRFPKNLLPEGFTSEAPVTFELSQQNSLKAKLQELIG